MTERVVVIQCPADLAFLSLLRQSVTAMCESAISGTEVYQLELAVSELATNVIVHAYHGITDGVINFQIALTENAVILDLHDGGAAFAFTEPRLPDGDALSEGGYGLFIVRQSVDVMRHTRGADERNHWHLEKRRAIAAHEGGKTQWT